MRLALCTALLLGSVAIPSWADPIDDVDALWLKGSYQEAFEKYSALEGDEVRISLGKSRCLSAEGKYGDALTLLTSLLIKHAEHADLLAEVGEIHFLHGRMDEAASFAQRSVANSATHLAGRWLQAKVLSARGRTAEANAAFEWFINYYNDEQPKDPESLLYVAQASAEFARRNKLPDEFEFILNTLLVDAKSANEHYWPANWFAGVLLVEKYNQAEGVPELKEALAINPNAVPALVGLGLAALQEHDFAQGTIYATQALAVNPNYPPAILLQADLLIADEKTDAAIEVLRKAQAVDPESEEVLGRLAACHYIQKREDQIAALERTAKRRNPNPGAFYYRLAEQLERRRKFEAGEKYFLLATKAAPYLAGAWNGLGMLYMRVGKEDDARKVFGEARDLDPFHIRVMNMTKVLRHMEEYKSVVSDHYEVVYHPKSDELLARYVSEYLEKTHKSLCDRFGYEPPGKTKIELMIDHKWFSGRVVGLPSIGTVGACTGKVVAIASPGSLKTPYNWARVMTHEVTHIITLQQTGYGIPHWYTEALAVHAEGVPRPQVWNQLLAERVPKGDLFHLLNINHAFVRPKTPLDWQMAYCQSLLYAEYMMKQFGNESIPQLLNAYRDGLETEAAIPKVFGKPLAEFEAGYKKHLAEVVSGLKKGPARKERSFAEAERAHRENPDDADIAAELAAHHYKRKSNIKARELAYKALQIRPKHPIASYVLAKMELSIGKVDEALKLIEPAYDPAQADEQVLELLAAIRIQRKEYDQAAQLYHKASAADPYSSKWLEGLARVYLLTQANDKLAEVLERLAGMDSDNLAVRKKLAELASKAKDWAAAKRWAMECLYVDVTDVEAHLTFARAAKETREHDRAVQEFEAALSLEPTDLKVSIELCECLVAAGQVDAAKQKLMDLVGAHPDNGEARKLLDSIGVRKQ